MFDFLKKMFNPAQHDLPAAFRDVIPTDQEVADAVYAVPPHFLQRDVLTVQGQSAFIYCGGQSYIGIGVTGTWVGTLKAFGSIDGINFIVPLDLIPYPYGTAITGSTGFTANANYWLNVGNFVAVKVTATTLTSGSAIVYLAATADQTYADAYLAQTAKYNSQSATSGTNTLAQAANPNHAWKLTGCTISFAGPPFAGGAAQVTIYDGTVSGSVLYKEYLATPSVSGSIGWSQVLNLPTNANGNKEVIGTPGNAMTIQVTGVPGQSTVINAGFESN